MKIIIVYGSTIGNTKNAAELIESKISDLGDVSMKTADEVSAEEIAEHDLAFLGSSTWGFGELQDDWHDLNEALQGVDLSKTKVALFGTGDQESYSTTFVDSLGIIAESVKGAGATIVGQTSTDGYTFDESKAVVDNKFVGLALDDDNQSDMTEERVSNWLENVKKEI